MMETALAIRAYTVSQIKPHLDPLLSERFLPQTVPAYAATETINELRKNHPEYAYKEATLNPSNPRDRASDWEADLVASFRNAMDVKELTGERDTPTGRHMYIARPIQITNPACLACHNTPATAPPSMVKVYGEANGFGWKMNEIIGAQVVSVPMMVPAPGRMSTITCRPQRLVNSFAISRAQLSLGPPGGNGRTTRIGLSGQLDWASAGERVAAPSQAPSGSPFSRRSVSAIEARNRRVRSATSDSDPRISQVPRPMPAAAKAFFGSHRA